MRAVSDSMVAKLRKVCPELTYDQARKGLEAALDRPLPPPVSNFPFALSEVELAVVLNAGKQAYAFQTGKRYQPIGLGVVGVLVDVINRALVTFTAPADQPHQRKEGS